MNVGDLIKNTFGTRHSVLLEHQGKIPSPSTPGTVNSQNGFQSPVESPLTTQSPERASDTKTSVRLDGGGERRWVEVARLDGGGARRWVEANQETTKRKHEGEDSVDSHRTRRNTFDPHPATVGGEGEGDLG